MSSSARVFFAVLTALSVIAILRLVRRRDLRAKYGLLWAFVGTVMVALVIIPNVLDLLARTVGISYGPAILFAVALVFLLLLCVNFSYEISRLEARVRQLAEEQALTTLQTNTARDTSGTAGRAAGLP